MAEETVVIKGVDQRAYRMLKSKAAKEGLTMGEAATLAFNKWSNKETDSILSRRIRDTERMRKAARSMDEIRSKLKISSDWSSERVIREWRDKRHPS